MQTYSQALTAGQTMTLNRSGRYFTILNAAGVLTVRFYKEGRLLAEATDVRASFYAKYPDGFTSVEVTTATAQDIKLGVGDGEGGSNEISGYVTIQNANGALTGTAKTVTTTSAQLLPANSARRYVMVQNRDPAGNVFLAFGVTATAANGVKIGPGQSFTAEVFAPANAINAIGDIASNANVLVVEG